MQNSNPCGLRRGRGGLTLVEVVVSLALLATLVVGILLAYGAHQRQIRAAEKRLEALEIADELLAAWYGSGATIPLGREGPAVGAANTWRWKTTIVRRQRMGNARFLIVRLDIMPAVASNTWGPIASSLELVVYPATGSSGGT